jgi:hypothetical protein
MDEESRLLLLSERTERRHLGGLQEFKIEFSKFRCRLEADAPAYYDFGFLCLVSYD